MRFERIGRYAVTAKIGEGGMGEAYRATDTKLDRDVALKVPPEAFTFEPDRLARFESREERRRNVVRALTLLCLSCAVSLSLGLAPQEAACDAVGDVQFICGIISPEDLAVVPANRYSRRNRSSTGSSRAPQPSGDTREMNPLNSASLLISGGEDSLRAVHRRSATTGRAMPLPVWS